MTISVADVRAVYPKGGALRDSVITSAIENSQVIVDQFFAGSSYSTILSDTIQKYLAAHFLAISYEQGGIIRKRTGDSEENYRHLPSNAMGLATTVYGEQALALDLGGYLSPTATNPVKAMFRIV